ncbi:MAG: 30S ribosomal protein S19 [Candidatus Dadabacteria bacterium]|nr:30S ribosomal protein S19 [Candidatus Dadabacteria bacterium]
MAEKTKKQPFVHEKLLKKVMAVKGAAGKSDVYIKTWSRSSMVIPEMIGLTIAVHNGKRFIPVSVNEHMIGHKLGEFSPTRNFHGHAGGDKKSKMG